jgi:hypothetical protein
VVYEIDWTDPIKSEHNWGGRMIDGIKCEIDWTDPVRSEHNWGG